jgi:hypothetical protein
MIYSFLFLLWCVTILPNPTLTNWHGIAEQVLTKIQATLQENHPGACDNNSEVALRLRKTNDFFEQHKQKIVDNSSFQQFLKSYIREFNDSHLTIEFPEEKSISHLWQWPNLLTTYDPLTKKFLLSKNIDDQIPLSKDHRHSFNYTELIKINDQEPILWLSKNVFPFFNCGILGCESFLIKAAPFALFNTQNPFAEEPKTITVKATASCRCIWGGQNSEHTISLEQIPISKKHVFKIVRETRKLDPNKNAFLSTVTHEEKQTTYVRIPTFAPENKSQSLALKKVIKKLASCKKSDRIVFDIRNNGGGSSQYANELLSVLFGPEFVTQQRTQADLKQTCAWRASTKNIQHLEALARSGVFHLINQPEIQLTDEVRSWAKNMTENLQTAQGNGDTFFIEGDDKTEHSSTQIAPESSAKIYFMTDSGNASAALDFIDYAKACGNITLLGHPTSADSVYMELSSEKITLTGTEVYLYFPIKEYKNRPRAHNQPYTPTHVLPLNLMNRYPAHKQVSLFIHDIDEWLKEPRQSWISTAN